MILLGMNMLAYRICLTFFLKETSSYFYLFSIFPLVIIFVFLFFPFKCLMHKLRLGVIVQFFKSFFPFKKSGVRFKEYISCDVITSVTYPFVSLVVAICLLSCEKCRKLDLNYDCKRYNTAAIIVQMLPFFARAMQCLNKMYYTQKRLLYFLNCTKYLSKCGFIVITYLTKTSKKY